MAVNVQSLPQAVRRTRAEQVAARPVPVSSLVVLADLVALLAATVIVGGLGWWGVGWVTATVAALGVCGTYRIPIAPSLSGDAATVVGCIAVPLVALAAVPGQRAVSAELLSAGLLAIALVLAARMASYFALRMLRRHGALIEPTLIIGAGSVGVEVAKVLDTHPEYGLVPVGFLDSFDDGDLPLPVLGNVRSLDSVLREYGVRRVIIAFGGTREPDMVPVVRSCERASVDIHVLPRFFELGGPYKGRDIDDVWGIPLVRLRRSALRSWAWSAKRVLDVVVAGLAIVVLAPLMALVALAVKLSSPGPVLFRQERVGQGGRIVRVLKFRSMRVNDDSDTCWSVNGDDRATPVGRFLRSTSLDELPQLFNVVHGDMSLVGPRPERPFFVDRFQSEVPRYDDRHRVPVGMTGWAQVHGLRGDTSIPQRSRFDNRYIETWSLGRDLVILVRTVAAVGRDAVGALRTQRAQRAPRTRSVARDSHSARLACMDTSRLAFSSTRARAAVPSDVRQ